MVIAGLKTNISGMKELAEWYIEQVKYDPGAPVPFEAILDSFDPINWATVNIMAYTVTVKEDEEPGTRNPVEVTARSDVRRATLIHRDFIDFDEASTTDFKEALMQREYQR